jgi:bacteriocin-like protein
MKTENQNSPTLINYLDDGTFEILSDNELAAIVGGVAVQSEPTNTGCNSNCTPINLGC